MSVEEMLQAAQSRARTVVVEVAGDEAVGAHLRAEVDAPGWVSHYFEALQAGYLGWTWVVSLSAVTPGDEPTVNDVVLLPGSGAVLAPQWTPYRERVRPGDLSPGVVLPPEPDDLRLVPAWSAGDDDTQGADRAEIRDLTGGRTWVLSREGRDMAAQRWHDGAGGPHVPLAQQASGTCRTCGFRIGLAGPLGDRFGVCGNGMANDDGRVVDFQHGCGAHSGVKLRRTVANPVLPDPYFDTISVDDIAFPPPTPPLTEPDAGAVDMDEAGAAAPSTEHDVAAAEPADHAPVAEAPAAETGTTTEEQDPGRDEPHA